MTSTHDDVMFVASVLHHWPLINSIDVAQVCVDRHRLSRKVSGDNQVTSSVPVDLH